ncbi:MAG: NADPH-dependent assimilatory sulfite reductase hemoprotein subunit [bacterium]|nr:NADPH-dependent assimilatory sulfite reductase hemoprotein subunit [bacterium]
MPRELPSGPVVTLLTGSLADMSKNERIKVESKGLFHVLDPKEPHSFRDELVEMGSGERETLSGNAKELSKFFGIYKQQARGERGKKTQDHFCMVRIKNPAGGRLTGRQWIALDDAAEAYADGTLRITSRQAVQYHRVYGDKLGAMIRHLNKGYLDHGTLGACGDVNRNLMGSPIDTLDPDTDCGAQELSQEIAAELAPRTTSYFEIFLSDEEGATAGRVTPEEPLYGEQYLPRKFKIGLAHPRDNSVDLRTQDVGLLPVDGTGKVWELYTGGGLGLSHNNPNTAALLGLHLGRVRREQVVAACRAIVILQKENGDRKDRKQARWKYTIRRLGVDAVKTALRERFEIELEDSLEPAALPPMELHLGWHEQGGGASYYGLSVASGRLKGAQRAAVREAVEQLGLSVVLTAQQDLLLCDVRDRAALEAILGRHGLAATGDSQLARANAMACPAKPTCGLAMTEAENILPTYFDALEAQGLGDVDVVIRMTGCPNNCARPPTAEIGIYGYGKNDHVVLVGGSRGGDRSAHPLYSRLPGEKMVPALAGLFRAIKEQNPEGLPAGDFLHQTDPETLRGWVGIKDE